MTEDIERDLTDGVDRSRAAAGPVPALEDAEPTADGGAPVQPTAQGARPTNAGRVWVSLAVATVLLVALIIFIAENSRSVTISFLGASGHISLALALLIAAVVGAAVTLLAGTARILQLRWEVRRTRRAGEMPRRHRFQAR